MKMWMLMLAVVALSGSTVIAAEAAKHEPKSTDASENTDKKEDTSKTETPAKKSDVRDRLNELISVCRAQQSGVAAKPQVPALPVNPALDSTTKK